MMDAAEENGERRADGEKEGEAAKVQIKFIVHNFGWLHQREEVKAEGEEMGVSRWEIGDGRESRTPTSICHLLSPIY